MSYTFYAMIKFIVVCFLLAAPTSFGLSGLLEMSQVLWTKLLNGGLSNIGPLDPLQVPIVKVDQLQGRMNYRMILSNIEILGLNDSSLESIHVGRGSVKTNLSENEAGYVSYNDRNAIDFIRYRFHTVVKEPNSNQSHSEDLTVEPLEKYIKSDDVSGRQEEVGTGIKSSRYQESRERHIDEDYNRHHADNYQQEQKNHYPQQFQQHQNQQIRDPDDFVPSRQSNYHHQKQYRNNDGNDRYYGNVHRNGYQNQHHQHQQGRVHDDYMPHRELNHHQGNQHRNNKDANNDNGFVNIYQKGQRIRYQRPQYEHQHSDHQDDSEQYKESDTSQGPTRRPFKQAEYDENYEKHQQIPRIEGFKTSTVIRNLGNHNYNDNNGERSYLVYAQTGSNSNSENGKNNYQNNQRLRENYERISSNVETSKDDEIKQMDGRVEIKYPAHLNNRHRSYKDAKDDGDVGMTNRGQLNAHKRYQEPSARLEDQPSYIDVVYADNISKKMQHCGNVRVEPRGDKAVYSLEDVKRDLENHRRFIVHNFTESELLSKKNDRVRTAEETKRIKEMLRYAKEFQENHGFFEEGMELIYHYGNGSEAKVLKGKRIKREHVEENENEDDIMHVVFKIHVPLLRVEADYVLLGKVDDQVLHGSGRLSGNFTELIGDFTIELKKSNNNTLIVRAARAKLLAASQSIKLEGMDEDGAVREILTQGLMAAEAVAAMLADDLATKALNESATDAIIYKLYKELPPH